MREIIAERAESGASVLFSSHQLDLVEDLCEEVVIIANGRMIASGRISDLRAASPTRRLRVSWIDEVSDWQPVEGVRSFFDGIGRRRTATRCRHRGRDRSGLAAGPVSAVGIEPPGLDEIFAELVDGERANEPLGGTAA